MTFDEAFAFRVRPLPAEVEGLTEKKMFGGLAFLIEGHMSVGVYGSELIVRVDPSETEDALMQPGVRMFDITGRPMKGWLLVSTAALAGKPALAASVRRGVSFACSMPPK